MLGNLTKRRSRRRTSKKNRMSKKMRLFLKTFLITIFSLSVVTVVGAMAFFRVVSPPDVPTVGPRAMLVELSSGFEQLEYENSEQGFEYIWPAPERFTADDRREMFFTFLIIGLNEGMNANTVMVASYCYVTREANLISIPRDMPVHPTRNGRKLSSSYLAGSSRGRGMAGGIAQVQRDVMNVIGFIPDFYILIDYDAFFSIIDAIGGIEIYVPIRMRYDDPIDNLRIDIQPGLQHMNSETALHFVRFRQSNPGSRYPSLPDGDFGRIRNQQEVINAVVSQLLRPASILRIPEFVNIFNESVHTDLTVGNMLWFANQLNNVRGTDDLSSYTLPVTGTSGAPMWYELLDASAAVELVNRTVNPFDRDIELRDLNVIR